MTEDRPFRVALVEACVNPAGLPVVLTQRLPEIYRSEPVGDVTQWFQC
jgi:hypothetical protein